MILVVCFRSLQSCSREYPRCAGHHSRLVAHCCSCDNHHSLCETDNVVYVTVLRSFVDSKPKLHSYPIKVLKLKLILIYFVMYIFFGDNSLLYHIYFGL